jgi:hypothetical protein
VGLSDTNFEREKQAMFDLILHSGFKEDKNFKSLQCTMDMR